MCLKALQKSAEYLDELRHRFGNLGLAAAAYNAGENGLANYLGGGNLQPRRAGMSWPSPPAASMIGNPTIPDVPERAINKDRPFVESCAGTC